MVSMCVLLSFVVFDGLVLIILSCVCVLVFICGLVFVFGLVLCSVYFDYLLTFWGVCFGLIMFDHSVCVCVLVRIWCFRWCVVFWVLFWGVVVDLCVVFLCFLMVLCMVVCLSFFVLCVIRIWMCWQVLLSCLIVIEVVVDCGF